MDELKKNGINFTAGTVLRPDWLPSEDELVAAFQTLHCPGSKSRLSVGARALSKHVSRRADDEASGHPKPCLWNRSGVSEAMSRGNEASKNDVALSVLRYVIRNCSWKNLFQTTGGRVLFEIRVPDGRGIRWRIVETKDGTESRTTCTFVGLVEPAQRCPREHE